MPWKRRTGYLWNSSRRKSEIVLGVQGRLDSDEDAQLTDSSKDMLR